MTKTHWLNITEYVAIAASIGGTIGTIITQQVIFTATPLTIALALNTINRQRQFISIRQLPEHNKLIEIYNDLISVNEDYRFHKLEIQEKVEKSEQNLALFKSFLEQFKDSYKNDMSKLYDKISILENKQNEVNFKALNKFYLSQNQKLNTVENVINSNKEQFINYQTKLKDFEQNQVLLKSILEQFKDFYQKEISKLYNKVSVLEDQQDEAKINELHQLYSSLTQRLNTIEHIINNTQNGVKTKPHNHKTSPYDPTRDAIDNIENLNNRISDITKRFNGLL